MCITNGNNNNIDMKLSRDYHVMRSHDPVCAGLFENGVLLADTLLLHMHIMACIVST